MRSLALLLVVSLVACSSENDTIVKTSVSQNDIRSPPLKRLIGPNCEFKRLASASPHIKENRSAIIADGETIFLFDEYKSVSDDVVVKTIVVKGKLIMKPWPMFIVGDEKAGSGEAVPQGMPMPPGTGLKSKSVYYRQESGKLAWAYHVSVSLMKGKAEVLYAIVLKFDDHPEVTIVYLTGHTC